MNIIIRILCFLGMCLVLPAWTFAASSEGLAGVETRISSETMTYFASKQKITFQGKVHVVRPDFELWSDVLNVYLKPVSKGKKKSETGGLPKGMETGDVERIVAEHNVRMKRDTSLGKAAKVTYIADTGVLIMEGQPSLTDDGSVISGHIIKYYSNEDRSEVLGAPGKQVHVVFPPNKSKRPPKELEKTTQGTPAP